MHTPGPWKISDRPVELARANPGDDETYGLKPILQGMNEICFVYEQDEANARLIAAAPELLAALIDAVGMLEHYTSGRPDNWDGSTEGQALSTIRDAHAAIAKARQG